MPCCTMMTGTDRRIQRPMMEFGTNSEVQVDILYINKCRHCDLL